MPKKITEFELLPLLRRYINELKKGKQLQPNGKKIKKDSITNYLYLEKLLINFSSSRNLKLRIKIVSGVNKALFEAEKKYWKKFYTDFTGYLYNDLGHFDNYVGSTTKLLRTFFNYLNNEKGLITGNFHKKFFTPSEEIEIIVLSPERLKYLIYSTELENKLTPVLRRVKDIFIFGCAVGLRYSDLINLELANIEVNDCNTYIKVQSKKTETFTKVKLPDYAVDIINKYKGKSKKRLLPFINKVFLNKKIKHLMETAGFTEPVIKTRRRQGIPIKLNKDEKHKNGFRFCDLITTHTMRRTAITYLLSHGMNEQVVRKISGHAANSKEFYRYVSFAQTFIDKEIDLVHEKMFKKHQELA